MQVALARDQAYIRLPLDTLSVAQALAYCNPSLAGAAGAGVTPGVVAGGVVAGGPGVRVPQCPWNQHITLWPAA